MSDYSHGVEMIPPEEIKSGGVTDQMAHQWKLLQQLQVGSERWWGGHATWHD